MIDHRNRLSSPRELVLLRRPLRRAETLEKFFLYWIPVDATPPPQAQSFWLQAFFDRLIAFLTKEGKLRTEVFLQYKTVYPNLLDHFLDRSMEWIPIVGYARTPGVPLPPIPTLKSMQPLIDGEKPFDFGDYVGDFTYWFVWKEEKQQRDLFFGYGGLTMMFMPPDPAAIAKPPYISKRMREHPVFKPIFDRSDPARTITTGQSMGDKWLKQSLDIYGPDLPQSPQMKGIPFVIPRLKSIHFLNSEEERQKLSTLCDFYIAESPEDQGVLLASAKDYDEPIIDILDQMRAAGLEYPER